MPEPGCDLPAALEGSAVRGERGSISSSSYSTRAIRCMPSLFLNGRITTGHVATDLEMQVVGTSKEVSLPWHIFIYL